MIMASKAKISLVGPIEGSKFVRIPKKTPAIETIERGKSHRQPEKMAVVNAHQLSHFLIVGDRTKGPAQHGVI